ncbi:pyrimidine 5'-nucleotidase [Vibrio viridaestus]|uniref:DUMP phosphatase n=1 Tax=Vibrio viridaestus TaxID=2487322 RepID=A0A3N9U8Q8_9VIBR|nr:pyrimidine 5'-nucleotidase [Vibrio viridaestus]RQW64596.1 dUMP phosphatase [Vibrio viridaestus]
MQLDWLVFDADETLFHFDAFNGLKRMFSGYDVDFNRADFEQYQSCNLPLWKAYQNNEITADELKHTRFESWASHLGVTTKQLNSQFLENMADICALLPGVESLLQSLHGHYRLAIITNGFVDLQEVRLKKVGIFHMFDHLVVSEKVGVAKPHNDIFFHTHQLMGMPDKQKVMMIGDNLHSDILGGLKYGFKTCWLNRTNDSLSEGIQPDFEISEMSQLINVINS